MKFGIIFLYFFGVIPVYSRRAINVGDVTRQAFGPDQPTIYPLAKKRGETDDPDKMIESAQAVYNNQLSRLWSVTAQGGYLDEHASTAAVDALSRGQKAMSDAHDSVNQMYGSQTSLPEAQSKQAQSVVAQGEMEAASDILAAASAISDGIRVDGSTGILQSDVSSSGSVITSPSKGAQAAETSGGNSTARSTVKSSASNKSGTKETQATESKQSSSGFPQNSKGTMIGAAFAPAILLWIFVM